MAKIQIGDLIRDMTAEELASIQPTLEDKLSILRMERNSLLAQTDYLALSDQTMTAEMTSYRQALRDITNGLTTVEDVNNVVFPERPEV